MNDQARAARREWLLITLITLVAAWLRFRSLGVPSLWLDELIIVDLGRELHPSWWQWLIGFEPENGPLYFALQRLGDHLAQPEIGARLFPAIAGTLSVPLAWLVARRTGVERNVAIFFALLMAVSPFHVYYSREGRGYALLVFATLLASLALASRPSWKVAAAALVLAAYVAASSAPLIGATTAVALVVWFWSRRDSSRSEEARDALRVGAVGVIATFLLLLLYVRLPHADISDVPFVTPLSEVWRITANAFTLSALPRARLDRFSLVALLLAVIGVVGNLRNRRLLRVLAIGYGALLMSLAALMAMHHWFSVRYLIFGLPAFLLSVTAGAVVLSKLAAGLLPARARERAAFVLLVAVIGALVWKESPYALFDPFEKADWRGVAQRLEKRARAGDTVIASNAWSAASLRFYLRPESRGIHLLDVNESVPMARYVSGRRPRTWLISGGFHLHDEIRTWMATESLLVDSDRLDELRLYYKPGIADFLQSRATPGDRQRYEAVLLQGRHGSLDVAADGSLFTSGWSGPELDGGGFRWCSAQCSLEVPRLSQPLTLSLSVAPYGRDQTPSWTVAADGKLETHHGNQLVRVPIPARDATSAITRVTLQFPAAASPAAQGISGDRRVLGGTVRGLSLAPDAGAAAGPFVSVFRFAERKVESRDLRVPAWREDALRGLLLRCGSSAEPRLLTREALDQIVVDAALDVEHESDAQFLEFVRQLLFGRHADPSLLHTYGAFLHQGVSRARAIRWLLRGADFRAMYLQPAGHTAS